MIRSTIDSSDIPAEWHEDMRKAWEREKLRADAADNLLREAIKVLESCEAKLEYMGNHRVGTRDAPDCLHRAAKARNIIATIRRVLVGMAL